MKITNPSFNEIHITIYPWIMLLVGIMFIGIGSIFTGGFSLSYAINCQEKSPQMARGCSLERSSLYLYQSQTMLGELQQVKLISWKNSKGKRQYRVKLIGTKSSTRFGDFSNLNKVTGMALVNKIKRYIKTGSQPKLKIGRLASIWFVLFGAIFPTIGLFVLLTAKKIQLTLNKSSNTLTLNRKSLLGLTTLSIPINEIKEFILENSRSNNGQTTYRVSIVKKDDDIIPIQTSYDNLYQQKTKLIDKLNQFLLLHTSQSVITAEKKIDKQKRLAQIFFVIGFVCFAVITGTLVFYQ